MFNVPLIWNILLVGSTQPASNAQDIAMPPTPMIKAIVLKAFALFQLAS
jgi:hypothetical protein